MTELLHLIDGSGYIFRAYYAIRALATASGEPTNAIYGFATMIEKALREEQPVRLAIVFDTGRDAHRSGIYPAYKANRPPPPEDLSVQVPKIHELAGAFRIQNLTIPNVEADDVIATLTRMALEKGWKVHIITGDKDLMQLVGEGVTLYEPMRGQRFGAAEVEEKMGVPPRLLGDALALAGDSVDNVPGVRGIGLKKAAKLLLDYGGLEEVLAAAVAGKVKGKMGEVLAECVEDARISRRLVALRDDVALPIADLDELRYEGPDKAKLKEIYTALEFRRLVPKLEGEAAEEGGEEGAEVPRPARPSVSVEISRDGYRAIREPAEIAKLIADLQETRVMALAVEAEEGRLVDATVHGLAVAARRGEVCYLPFGAGALEPQETFQRLRGVLEDRSIAKISAETKALVELARRFGVEVQGLAFDSTLASYLLEPDETQHGPAAVARRYLGHEPLERTDVLGTAKKKRTFAQLALEEATALVGERADIALAARDVLGPALTEAEVAPVLREVELPLIPVLADMELAGVKIDVGRLSGMSERFAEELVKLEKACFEAAGHELNLGSPKQLQKVLFEELGLKIVKRTKTGPSTDQSVLEVLADAHPLPQAILDYRQVQKLKSTYVDALPKMVSPVTGRVHTTFGQATAATGRLSSTDPNLQNIPIRSDIGRELRKVFVAEPGNLLVSVDYSQIELRVLAHFCTDEVLLSAFRENADVHTRTASVLFEIPPDEVTREQRTQAKAVNFGVLYGMGPVRLARDLGIPRRTASKFIDDYFSRQPGVGRYIEQTLEEARKTGVVRTLLGRRRPVPDLGSRNRGARAAAERVATNTPIQGSAADLIKLAMVRVAAVLAETFPKARLLLQVHDELLLEAPEAQAQAVAQMVKREMERIYPLEVPLVAEAHVGPDWDAAH